MSLSVLVGIVAFLFDKEVPDDVCFSGECTTSGKIKSYGGVGHVAELELMKKLGLKLVVCSTSMADILVHHIQERPTRYRGIEVLGVEEVEELIENYVKEL